MSDNYTNEELALMVKYGNLETALRTWWGRHAKPEEQWEVDALRKWQESNRRIKTKVG